MKKILLLILLLVAVTLLVIGYVFLSGSTFSAEARQFLRSLLRALF